MALLLHLDDLHPESLPLGSARIVRVGGLVAQSGGAADRIRGTNEVAMRDALARAATFFRCPAGPAEPGWSGDLPIVTGWAPVGYSAEALPPCFRVRREWDSHTWPRTTRSYAQVRAAIPSILRATGVLPR